MKFPCLRSMPIALLAVAPLTALSNIAVYAQTEPPPQGPTLAEAVSRFTAQAANFIESLATQAGTVQDWATSITWLLVPVIILYAGLREYHENSGHGRHLFWWFARLAVCMFLLGIGQNVISAFYSVGRELAAGNIEAGYESPLYNLFQERELEFHLNYQKMVSTQFQVRVDDNDEYGTFDPDGYKFLYPLYTGTGSEPRDIMAKMGQPVWIIQASFAVMTTARAVLELGNLWLVVLGGLLVLVYKVTCPIFIALAIDRRLSHRMVHSWVWGLIILTLVWPSVSYFLRAIAYMAGDLGLSVAGDNPTYVWNGDQLAVVLDSQAHPEFLIAFASVMMLGAGLAVWFSPLIAYRLAYGQVFETVSQTVSQLATSIGGLGVSMYNAILGAAITRQAEQVNYQAQYDASTALARADRRIQDMGVNASRVGALAGIRAGQVKGLIDNQAGLVANLKSIEAGKVFDQKNTELGLNLSQVLAGVGVRKESEDATFGATQSLRQLEASARGQYWSLAGGKVDLVTGSGRLGSAAGVGLHGFGIRDNYNLQNEATKEALRGVNGQTGLDQAGRRENMYSATDRSVGAYEDNFAGLQANQETYAVARSGIAREQAGTIAGGINRAALIQTEGVDRTNEIQYQANQIRLDAVIEAETVRRKAAAEVTRLHFENRVRQSVYDSAARLIEKHLEQRF